MKIVKAFKNTFYFKPNLFIFEKLFVVIVKHSVTCTQFWAKKLLLRKDFKIKKNFFFFEKNQQNCCQVQNFIRELSPAQKKGKTFSFFSEAERKVKKEMIFWKL